MSGSFLVSPGVIVKEQDLSDIIPSIATSPAGTAGYFEWGEVLSPQLVTSENELVQLFGKPNDRTYKSFFTASNFLSYANNLLVTRAPARYAFNSFDNSDGDPLWSQALISGAATITYTAGSKVISGGVDASLIGYYIIIDTDKVLGQVVSVTAGTNPTATLSDYSIYTGLLQPFISVARNIINNYEDYTLKIGNYINGKFIAKYPGEFGNSISVSICDKTNFNYTSGPATTSVKSTSNVEILLATRTNNVITFTTKGTHNLSIGQLIIVTDSDIFNGTYTVSNSGITELQFQASRGGNDATSNVGKVSSKQVYGTNANFGATAVFGDVILTENNIIIGIVQSAGTTVTLQEVAKVHYNGTGYKTQWKYKNLFQHTPGTSQFAAGLKATNDELHIVVIDTHGLFSGTVGTILEKYESVSKASNAISPNGTSNYYKTVLAKNSNYIYANNLPIGINNWATYASSGIIFDSLAVTSQDYNLTSGSNGIKSTDGDIMMAYDLYANAETYDIALIPVGESSATLANYVISLAENKKDAIAFVSPQLVNGTPIVGKNIQQQNDMITYANSIMSSSYGVIDSGYKYQYDRYSDIYRYVPLNGDIAGLCARCDYTHDAWWSPAGYTRGQIKNVAKLAFNPSQQNRDALFQARINPIVSFPGQGTILFGDKTAIGNSTSFDAIGIRRLFIVLEKSIATASKFKLFEYNDAFTRNQFKAMVEPFLRDVKGRRGITDFMVICDETNNTPDVIDSNNFVASIYIKPNHSIRYITLNFISTRSGISFSEAGA